MTPRTLDILRANVARELRGSRVQMPRGAPADLAREIDMKPSHLSRFLSQGKPIGWEYVDRMAVYFKCQIGDLFLAPKHSNDRSKMSARLSSPVTGKHGKTTALTPSPTGGGHALSPSDARIYELEETLRHALVEGRDILEQLEHVLDSGQVRATPRTTPRTRKVSGSRRQRPTE